MKSRNIPKLKKKGRGERATIGSREEERGYPYTEGPGSERAVLVR